LRAGNYGTIYLFIKVRFFSISSHPCELWAVNRWRDTDRHTRPPKSLGIARHVNIVTVANKVTTEQKSIPVAVLVVALVVILGAGFFLYLDRASRQPAPSPAPLTAEAKAYVHNLQLMDVDMQKHESYMKQAVVEITGKIGNNGDRNLRVVEINCVFYDPYGQLVLRQRVPIVSQKIGGLALGEIKNFRLAFDNIPDSWNQALPQLVIAEIVFG